MRLFDGRRWFVQQFPKEGKEEEEEEEGNAGRSRENEEKGKGKKKKEGVPRVQWG